MFFIKTNIFCKRTLAQLYINLQTKSNILVMHYFKASFSMQKIFLLVSAVVVSVMLVIEVVVVVVPERRVAVH